MLFRPDRVNLQKPNNSGQTPLVRAAHEGALKIPLLRQQVDPGRPDYLRQTPLVSGAWGGHERVVKILLERKEVNPDKPANYYGTPLPHAVPPLHERVVTLLQSHKAVAPSTI